MSKSSRRVKYATNRNYSSENDPRIVEVIRKKNKEVLEKSDASRIAQDEEIGRIRQKNQAEKKYKKKHDHATLKLLEPHRKGGQNLNASHRREGGDEESDDSESDDEEEGEDESEKEASDKEVDEEIREVVQEQEVKQQDQVGDAQEKGKKKDGPKKKKGDHMPDPLKMFSRDPDDPPLGIPGDRGKVLWGYKGSWASDCHEENSCNF
ncbi:uncharacterized protein DDB_G0286299-like [Papaver somniferum]|uniref:uncharacterized protein DDB_G0286299-like n=1 Tax=Papaver somniferum TaxID=3469 RepID=UPI000E6F902E|nr:uncharacterized protein DDB_G0286299-like [Papaver somniferum]